MDDIKKIIAKNLIELRRTNGITQAQLAEKLNYSDKAISKWERAESVPHISILKEIADIFEVTVDYLITETHADIKKEKSDNDNWKHRNRVMITGISVLLVWLLATFVFVLVRFVVGTQDWTWLIFLYSLPCSFIVWLIFNAIWFNKKRNFPIVSMLMWTALSSVYVSFLMFGFNGGWLVFVIGVPAQAIILLWSGIRLNKQPKIKRRKHETEN